MNSNHMGLVPLNDTIIVTRQLDNGSVDDWGVAVYEEKSTEYKCHISYNYKLETIAVKGISDELGKQVVYSAKIYIKRLVMIEYEDKITFTDMNGDIVEKKILNVYPVRDFSGKVLATCVYV